MSVRTTSPIVKRGVSFRPFVVRVAFSGLGFLSWTVLYTSLELGRTTPTTVSRGWLTTFFVVGAALLVWQSLFAVWLKSMSGLTSGNSIARTSVAVVPLLVSVPFLIATYQSDATFHYLTTNPIPRALVLFTPLLVALACQAATLIWNARLTGRIEAWIRMKHAVPLLIFAAFASLYIFSAGGHLYSPDEGYMYRATQKLAQLVPVGTLSAEDEPRPGGIEPAYSKYGLVTSLLAMPPYWISRVVGPEPDPPSAAFPIPNGAYPLVDLLVNPLVGAAICAVLYCLARQLGFRASTSLIVVLLYGLTTSAWVYAKTFFSQLPATFFLLATIYLLLYGRPTRRRYAAAGISLALAAGSRVEVLFLAVPLIALLLIRTRGDLRKGFGRSTVFAFCFALVLGSTVGWYNWVKTGSVLATGYGDQGTLAGFSPEPFVGLFGTLFSPGFSFVLYNPTVLLGIVGLPLLAIKRPFEAFFFGAMLALAYLFYGSFGDWSGGWTWGNRYLVVVLPYAILPIGMWLERPHRSSMSWLLVIGTALLGFVITGLAVLFDFNSGWLDLWDHRANTDLILWDPSYSPIAAHFRLFQNFLLTGAKLDLYLYYRLGVPAVLAFLLLFTMLLTLAIRAAHLSASEGLSGTP